MMKKLALSVPLSLLALLMVGCGRPVKWEYKTLICFTELVPGQKLDDPRAAEASKTEASTGMPAQKHLYLDEAFLNELGADGWELVASSPVIQPDAVGKTLRTTEATFVFKRPKQ